MSISSYQSINTCSSTKPDLLYQKNRKHTIGNIIKRILLISAVFSTFVVFLQIIFLMKEASGIFDHVSLMDFLFGNEWVPSNSENPRFGALTLIVGTLFTTIGALIIAVPIGIAVAIYIAEIAPSPIKNKIKTLIELLAGIPSVVFGFFGLVILSNWIKNIFNRPMGQSWLGASLILAIMCLPTIISVSEDALRSVPSEYREASLAIGADKWQTISQVVVPSASSGITTSIILGMGRALGETMAVIMIAGNTATIPEPLTNIFYPVRTITATVAIEMPEIAMGGAHYSALFGLVIVLFLIIIFLNSIAEHVLEKMHRKLHPKPNSSEESSKKLFKSFKRKHSLNKKDKKPVSKILLYSIMIFMLSSWLINYYRIGSTAIFSLIGVFMGIIVLDILYGKANTDKKQKIAFGLIKAALLFVVLSLFIVIGFIGIRGIRMISWEFLTSFPSNLGRDGGIFPAIIGSLQIMIGSILISAPLGVAAGIYLAEYAKEGSITRIIRMGIDNLNGTPSIVFGLFGMVVFVNLFGWRRSLLAGICTISLMILPTIIRTTEQSIKQVSDGLREGSLGLGATKWETIRKVVLPSAGPGIVTGVVLSMGRAIGECAPIMFTAATFFVGSVSNNPMEMIMALPYHIYIMATVVPDGTSVAYGSAFVLIIIVLFFYGIAMIIRKKINKKLLKTFSY